MSIINGGAGPGASPNVVHVSTQTFQDDVVERSKEIPVLLEFYAEGAEPSEQLTAILMRLVDKYQGKFVLARLNIQESPQLVQQLGVRGLPTLKLIFQGQMVQNLEGPQGEDVLIQMLDEVTMSPADRIREQIDILLAEGNRVEAITLLQALMTDEPGNFVIQTELCDLLIMESRLSEATALLASIPADAEGINRPRSRIEFLELAADLGSLDDLSVKVEAEPDNLQASYELALRLIVSDKIVEALDVLFAMMKQDRMFEDELARKTMVKVFDLLGKGDPVAGQYRRKMFGLLH